MKIIKRILKIALGLFLALILVVAGAGYYAYKNPEKVWALVQEKFLPKDLKITWKAFHVHAGHDQGRNWKPFVEFQGLCIQKKDPFVDVCLDDIHTTGSVSLEKWTEPKFEIYEATAISTYANVFQPGKKTEKKDEKEMNFYEMTETWRNRLKGWSKYLIVQQVHIDLEKFELRSPQEASMHFAAHVHSERLVDQASYDVAIRREPSFQFTSKGQLELNSFLNLEKDFASLEATLEMPKAKARIGNLNLKWTDQHSLSAHLQSLIQVPKKADAKIDLKAQLDARNLKVETVSNVTGLKKPFAHLKPVAANFRIPQETGRLWPKENADYAITAYLPLFFVEPKLRPEVEKACACRLPEELKIDGKGQANLHNYFSNRDGFLANTRVDIENLTNELFTTQTMVKADILRKDHEFKIEPFIDSKVELVSFQKAVALLKTQKIVIPAPFNVLDGKIRFAMKGPLESAQEIWKIPYLALVDLSSAEERVNVDTNGFLNVGLEKKLITSDIQILVKQLVLRLPDLDPIFGAPKVTKDQRFELTPPVPEKPKKKSAFAVRFSVQVKTTAPDSIRLLSQLAKPSIPIGIQMNYNSGSPVTGKISLSQFDVEYLRRKSTIEKLNLALNEPQGTFPLDGRFRVDQNPYKVYIDVVGTLKAPRVLLSSDPYLDRSDIISVLLYGRPNNQLVSADAKVVGSFDAALADRAIGLIGMWAFASTPIQSFSYNQLSKQYTASLKVSDDTTLAVGTNWEEATSLELQKRLSDRWMISASLEPTQDDPTEQTRKLQLQWEDRF